MHNERAARVLDILRANAGRCYGNYQTMTDKDGIGLARERARMNLSANIYTQWHWKADLNNPFHFLRLRADAQYEIRVYADANCSIVAEWVPIAFRAFDDYRLGAVTISAQMVEYLRRMLKGKR